MAPKGSPMGHGRWLASATVLVVLISACASSEGPPTADATIVSDDVAADGAAAVLLCSEEWAAEHKLPVQAFLTTGRSAAVDFVDDDKINLIGIEKVFQPRFRISLLKLLVIQN